MPHRPCTTSKLLNKEINMKKLTNKQKTFWDYLQREKGNSLSEHERLQRMQRLMSKCPIDALSRIQVVNIITQKVINE